MQSGKTPEAADPFNGIQLPDVTDMSLQLEQLVQQGVLTPEDAKAALVGQSEMNGISLDPKLKQAQMDALSGLQDISQGGMTAMDRANLAQIGSEEDAAARGSREAILQNAQARGMGGSGLELMANLKNQQDSATRKSARDTQVAGMAQQRALDALMQQGQLGGQIGAQDFNQQAQVAGANDAIAKFNAQNQQGVNMANTAARNDSQARNLAAKQSIADSNVQQRNAQQQYNKNLNQVAFENKLKRAGGTAGINAQNQAAAGQNSQNSANANNQMIGTGLTAAAMFMSDERSKEDIEEFSPSDFLDTLTGYKYSYKDKKHGEGQHVGVMAQDLEKSDAGAKLVVDTPEGKIVDYSKAGPTMMASLADINKRLKKIEGEG